MNRRDKGELNLGVVLMVLLLVMAGAAVFVFLTQGHDTAREAQNVVTGATQKANVVAVAADLQNLRLAVETAVVDSGGHLPTITLENGKYQVSDADNSAEDVPANAGVTSVGITGGTGEDYCIWVVADGGLTMHTNHSGEPEIGNC